MKHEIKLEDTMIFRSEYDGKIKYSISFSSRNPDGTYDHAYMPLSFPPKFFQNGVDIKNKTVANLTGFVGFSKHDGKTYWNLVVKNLEVIREEEQLDLTDTGFVESIESLPF